MRIMIEQDNYSDDLVQPEGFSLYYTFTEEDYNLAVDCEWLLFKAPTRCGGFFHLIIVW